MSAAFARTYAIDSQIAVGSLRSNVGSWHIPEVPALLVYVGCWGKTGRHLLAMSSSHIDPIRTSAALVLSIWDCANPSATNGAARAQCLPNWAASVSDTALSTGLVRGLSSRSRRLTLMMSVAFRSTK